MSPQECWAVLEAMKPPEKVGKMPRPQFEALKNQLIRAKQNANARNA